MKKVTTAAGVLLLLAGFGLVGCSADSQRVTVVGSDTALGGNLATEVDGDASYDWHDYASDGYYYPDEDDVTDVTWDPNGHDYDDPGWTNKPLDNGRDYY